MKKKHYLQLCVCVAIIFISSVLFAYYYKEYIAPESYTIGSLLKHDYTELSIADYFSDEDVLFSQNINSMSFSNAEGTSSYEFDFEAKKFNGLQNQYVIYVNDNITNEISQTAGAITSKYVLKYYDVNSGVLCTSNINIAFTFYSLSSKVKISLPTNELPYLRNYFKTDNFIVTLAYNPFTIGDKNGEIDEKLQQIEKFVIEYNDLAGEIDPYYAKLDKYSEDISELMQQDEDKSSELNSIASLIDADLNSLDLHKTSLEELKTNNSEYETKNSNLFEEDVVLKNKFESYKNDVLDLHDNLTSLISNLNDLKKLIESYSYASNKVTVTFMLNEKVYKIVSIDINSTATVDTPSNTDDYKFNYWQVEDEKIDLTEYTFSQNTIVVANITKKITISYYFGDSLFKTQRVYENEEVTFPSEQPEKTFYIFKGWSTDKQTVLEEFSSSTDVSLYAVFELTIDGTYSAIARPELMTIPSGGGDKFPNCSFTIKDGKLEKLTDNSNGSWKIQIEGYKITIQVFGSDFIGQPFVFDFSKGDTRLVASVGNKSVLVERLY